MWLTKRKSTHNLANTRHFTSAAPVAPAADVGIQSTAPGHNHTDAIDQIRKLGELRDAGILTEEEFTEKRTQILSRM
ncbi:SHOCT domain-containing protein [Gordonia sp. SCSIO 19800]|nr:SHOCT domain-containing protein [Gordonia sp. SCSIO 19800]